MCLPYDLCSMLDPALAARKSNRKRLEKKESEDANWLFSRSHFSSTPVFLWEQLGNSARISAGEYSSYLETLYSWTNIWFCLNPFSSDMQAVSSMQQEELILQIALGWCWAVSIFN